MSLMRQGRHFALVGVAQWLLDWSVLVVLTKTGVSIVAANIAARLAGAVLGFSLNGLITFSDNVASLGGVQFRRYVVLWCANAAVSTFAVATVDTSHGLHGAWIAKPVVDSVLAIGSFLASRHWVYR